MLGVGTLGSVPLSLKKQAAWGRMLSLWPEALPLSLSQFPWGHYPSLPHQCLPRLRVK